MSSQVNPSSINAQYPVPGVNQSSAGFRTNFLAIQNAFSQYVTEMNDVISKVIVSAPLLYGANVSINNFGGMQNSNLSLFDYGLVTSSVVASGANAVPALSFANTAVANINITAASPVTQSISFTNFPGLGYSEMEIVVEATNPPQFLNFANLTAGANLLGTSRIAGFNGANLAITDTNPKIIKFGSIDGANWFVSAPSTGVAKSYTPATSVGAPGDTTGMIAFDSTYMYICIAPYNGSSVIWHRAAFASF